MSRRDMVNAAQSTRSFLIHYSVCDHWQNVINKMAYKLIDALEPFPAFWTPGHDYTFAASGH